MNGFLVFVLIVGVVAAWWLIPKMIGKGIAAADRKLIRPNSYAKAQETVRGELSMTAQIAPDALLSRIVSDVGAATARPATMAKVYLKERTSSGVVFAFGSGFAGDIFVAAVEVSSSSGGSLGVFHVLAWKESGADVGGLTTLRQLRETVQKSVLAAGGVVNVVA